MLVSEFRGDTALALEPPTGWQFVLERPGQRAVVTEVGAAVRSWRTGGRERLDAFPVGSAGDGPCGKALVPWPDEVRDGRYSFDGVEHRLPVCHDGLLLWVNWRPVRRAVDRVALEYVVHPQPGYPFTVGVEVEYALSGSGLEAALRATNLGAGPAPFGAGFHACLPSDLDPGVVEVTPDADGVSRVRAGEVSLWMDDAFRYVRAEPRAVVPMTCAPDAFNSGDGLAVLAPGEALVARWGLALG